MYQALYRKWRPKTFADVVGQEHITETLQRQVAEGRLSHAYLFTGTRGTGKTTCAKILARAVNCEQPENGNPCNRCPSCLGIESGRLLDVVELDAASNNGVDSVRALRDEAGYWWVTYRKAFKRNFKASIAPGIFYCVVVTAQIFLVYFCFNMLSKGTNVGVPLWVATVLNLLIFQMLFAYMWPQVVLLDQPFSLTVKNSINCMIAFLPHALAAAIVQILFWGVVILCMPLGLLLMLIFGFWFVTEVSCQIIYGDIEKVFHIEESIRKMKDAELEAALQEDYGESTDDTEE